MSQTEVIELGVAGEPPDKRLVASGMSCAAAQGLRRRVGVEESTRSVLPSSPVGGDAYFVNSKSAVWVLPSKRLRDSVLQDLAYVLGVFQLTW